MNKYKIDHLRVSNFKSIRYFDHDFTEDILILDGPNGYGKTTLFDALELVIFGKIRRIDEFDVDRRFRYRDSLYSNEPDQDSVVQVRFTEVNPAPDSTETSFVVIKRLPAPGTQFTRDNSPKMWLFKTYITSEFRSEFDDLTESTQEDVCERLGETNLARTFHLFHYIQQEDKTFFLRQGEKQRLKELSALFDTTKETEERKKVDTVLKKVKADHDRVVEQLEQLEEERKSLSAETESVGDAIAHTPLLPDEALPEWDKPLSHLTKETRDVYLEELDDIKLFVEDFKSFTRALYNEDFDSYAQNEGLLRNAVISAFFINSREKLQVLHDRQSEHKSMKSKLETIDIDLLIENPKLIGDIVRLATALNVVFQESEVVGIVDEFRVQRKALAEVSTLVMNVNDAREKLKSSYEKFLEHQHVNSGVCPLCGADYGEYEELLEELAKRRDYFETFYGENTKELETKFTVFRNGFISDVIQAITQYLQEPDHVVDDRFYKQLESAFNVQQPIADFLTWCNTKELSVMNYVNQQTNRLEDAEIDSMVRNLREYLLGKRYEVPNKFIQNNKDWFKHLKRIYQNVFRNSDKAVTRLTAEMINRKKEYVNYVFYNSNSKKLIEIENKIHVFNMELRKHEELLPKLRDILRIYDSYIQKHWAKIIEDIEIVFYVYCGKIMQYYPRGIGMFIRPGKRTSDSGSDTEAESITFVYSMTSHQDAVNFLSSGQLSALVIAFTLSLHRVYGNHGLNTVLIDDPVQTMDDINMASLTELLRNDFGDKQILLSTHEDDVSRYLLYKFTRYGLNAERVGMKDLFVNQLANV